MASRKARMILYGAGGVLVCLAIGVASVLRWMQMAEDQRQELRLHEHEAMSWDRKQLSDYWGDKIQWFPDAAADPALAVMPRSKYNEFDAIYALFRGEKGRAVLALTQVGGYYDFEPILIREHPETMIPRKLTAEEMTDLAALRKLIEARLATLDPQLNQGGWNRNVARIVEDLERRQKAAGGAAAAADTAATATATTMTGLK